MAHKPKWRLIPFLSSQAEVLGHVMQESDYKEPETVSPAEVSVSFPAVILYAVDPVLMTYIWGTHYSNLSKSNKGWANHNTPPGWLPSDGTHRG